MHMHFQRLISLKVHMLHSQLDKFKHNMGANLEEQGEYFYQDFMNVINANIMKI